jgi:hypothetical protein
MINDVTSLPVISYNPANSIYIDQPYASLSSPPNPGLTWEKIRIINLATDFSFFNNKLSGSFEYYTKRGRDLVGLVEIERTTGTSEYMGNYASISGKGLDVVLNSQMAIRKLKYNASLLFSYNTDRVTEYLLKSAVAEQASVYINNTGFPVVGKPLYKIYVYKWAGLDSKTGDPLGFVGDDKQRFDKVLAANKAKDLVYVGNATPKYFGSFINSISFHDFSLSCNLTYKFGHYFKRPSVEYIRLLYSWGGHSDYSNRWKKNGDELLTTVPSAPIVLDNRDDFYRNSAVLVEKGDHIRLQDIRLSYEFNKNKHRNTLFSNAQLFIYGSDLGIIWRSNDLNIDPDFYSRITPSKSIAAGINVSF